MDHGRVGIGGDGLLEQIAGREAVQHAQLRQALPIEPLGFEVRGRYGGQHVRFRRRRFFHSHGLPQAGADPGHEIDEPSFGAALGHRRHRLARGHVLDPHVQADLVVEAEVGPQQHRVGAEVPSDLRERVAGEALGVGERQLHLHAADVLPRDRTEAPPRRQLGRQHVRERGREPAHLGVARQVLEAEHGDGAASGEPRGRGGRRNGFGEAAKTRDPHDDRDRAHQSEQRGRHERAPAVAPGEGGGPGAARGHDGRHLGEMHQHALEIARQVPCRRVALGRILGQAALDDPAQRRRHRGVERRDLGRLLDDDPGQRLRPAHVLEGGPARGHLVEDGAARELVGAEVQRPALGLLG